jgi:hypothetical protein
MNHREVAPLKDSIINLKALDSANVNPGLSHSPNKTGTMELVARP